jgi:tripartite ATP-independent transporter DctM subunit
VLIIGGLYAGIFTPTEAGGIGAFGALAIGLVRRQLTGSNFADSLLQTAKMSAMVIALIVGAFVFNHFLAITRIPFVTGEYIAGLGVNKYVVLLLVLILYIILGMLLDIYSACVLTIPVLYPVMMGLGFDPIWYGVIMVRVMEIGVISPPFAMNIFALAGVTKVPISKIYRAIIPFLLADFVHLALLCAVPLLSTFLPALMIKSI